MESISLCIFLHHIDLKALLGKNSGAHVTPPDEKGISLSKKAMKDIEKRLERNPLLPKWDILIRPA